MQRNNTACGNAAPIQSPTPPVTTPESTPPESTIALGQSATETAIERKTAIVIVEAIGNRKTAIVAGAIVLAGLFYWLPTLATGLIFAGALFGINTLVDAKMGGREND